MLQTWVRICVSASEHFEHLKIWHLESKWCIGIQMVWGSCCCRQWMIAAACSLVAAAAVLEDTVHIELRGLKKSWSSGYYIHHTLYIKNGNVMQCETNFTWYATVANSVHGYYCITSSTRPTRLPPLYFCLFSDLNYFYLFLTFNPSTVCEFNL